MAARTRPRWCSAVIAGAGSGLGREISLALTAKECIVFGTAASAEEVQEMRVASGGRASLAVCDLSRIDMVKVWADGVSDALDGAGLDLLVNIPALIPPGPLEVLPLEDLRQGFEDNVLGAVTVINAFLPALRKARGRIVQVSDWRASLPLPFDGAFAAAMAALEALASVYGAELKPSGIAVTVASVGRLEGVERVPMPGTSRHAAVQMPAEQRALYASRLKVARRHAEERRPSAVELSHAAARVIDVAEQNPASDRVAIGSEAETVLQAARNRSEEDLGKLRLQLAGLY